MRRNDYILLLVLALSISGGILFPRFGSLFHPYLVYFVMSLLFISFLSIDAGKIVGAVKGGHGRILFISLVKLIFLPVLAYYAFYLLFPSYALGALLLGGISTGVVAPFISNLVGGNTALVLTVVVLTSLLSPFSLPALVEILAGRSFDLALGAMIGLLAKVIFIPMAVGEVLRRTRPDAAGWLLKRSFPLSLFFFTLINLGVFSRHASFFRLNPSIFLQSLAAALVLALFFVGLGLTMFMKQSLDDRLAAAVSFSNMNNVIVIVFASEFFGPLEPTLAAVYMVPFFGLIIPLRLFRHYSKSMSGGGDSHAERT